MTLSAISFEAAAHAPAARRPVAHPQLAGEERLTTCGGSAVAALYRRHQPVVYRYCLGMLRAPEPAADAAQSTWMHVFVALSAPGAVVHNVGPWLRAIARNECLDLLRAHSGAQTVDISDLELSSGPTPEDAYESREQFESLLVDLRTLSERQRSAIVLREICGMGSDELADVFGTTRERASGLVADARRTLAQRRSGRLLSCTEVRDPLDAGQRSIALRAHLEICASCRRDERRRRQERARAA